MINATDLNARIANLSPAKRVLLERRLQEKGITSLIAPPILRRATGKTPLSSFAQQRLWFLNQLEPDSPVYNESKAVRLNGVLDPEALEKALNQIVARHEILRTTLVSDDGTPLQRVAGNRSIEVPLFDLRTFPDMEREAEAQRVMAEIIRRPFDLSRDLMLRTSLLRLADQEHILLVVTHHIASDGWSSAIFWRELSAFYAAFHSGQACTLPDLPVQYADYAIWQREWLQGKVLENQLSYWRKQLDNLATLQLPTDRPRPAVQTFRGAGEPFEITRDLSDALKALSRKERVTLYMTLLAGFQTLLHRYTSQQDIAVGSPIAGRNRVEVEGLIGFFVNTLVLRADLSGNPSFRELLRRVRRVALEAYEHQDLPFEKLVEEIHPERNLSHSPLFQIVFALQNGPERATDLLGLRVSPVDIRGETVKFDLHLSLVDADQGLKGRMHYCSDIFDRATIRRLLGHLEILLRAVVTNPEQRISALPILTPAEKHQLLVDWNDTKKDYAKDKCIHEIFEAQVEKTPNAIALVFEEQELTYRELNRRANQLAHYLQSQAVGPEVLVGIYMDRSIEMVVGLLAILKAGGAYVPLDPEYPKERLAFMLADARVKVLLTQTPLADTLTEDGALNTEAFVQRLTRPGANAKVICLDTDWIEIAKGRQDNPRGMVAAGNLVYVIYTSGSTGKPKGVAVEHRQLINYLLSVIDRLDLSSQKSLATVSTLAADMGNTVIFSSLITGGELHVMSRERITDAEAMADYFSHHAIDCLKIVPSHLAALQSVSNPERVLPRQLLILGGEASEVEWVRRLARLAPRCKIVNHYGPTETTIGVLTYAVDKDSFPVGSSYLPLGRPIANTQIYLLDHNLTPVPIGVTGEIYVGGLNLARGYLNRPELTAETFITNPFSNESGARLYKTGDQARYLPNGNIEFRGRNDNQIKVRGYRTEPGEIEAALKQHPTVREAVVLASSDNDAGTQLVAYVVVPPDLSPSVAGKPRYRLPNGMPVIQLNKNETDYLYEEIFERQAYLRHGITIENGDCILDVGANIGLFTLLASRIARCSRIYSFEPNPTVYEILKANSDLYGSDVKLFNFGLSDQAKHTTFTFFPNFSLLSGFYADAQAEKEVVKTFMTNQQKAGVSDMSELVEQADGILANRFSAQSFAAELRTLSSVIEQEKIQSIDLLKINVEKSELDVLSGIEEEDWKKIKQIVLEVDVEENLPIITSLLQRHGYEYLVEQDNLLQGTPLCYVYAIRPSRHKTLIKGQSNRAQFRSINPSLASFLSVEELRAFLQKLLPHYMIPSAFVFLSSLPLTPNGKIDYHALPSPHQTETGPGTPFVAPRTSTETVLAKIWKDVLKVEQVGVHDNFFDLGGHSLRATQVMSRIRKELHVEVPLRSLFEAPTVEQLAQQLFKEQFSPSQSSIWSEYPSTLVPFQPKGSKPPLFWFNWGPWDFRVPRYLDPDRPVYGLQHQSGDGHRALYTSIEDMAGYYIKEIRSVQAKGPYFIGGLCIGGMIAFEMAQQLQTVNEEVALLVLLDPSNPHLGELSSPAQAVPSLSSYIKSLRNKIHRHLRELRFLEPQEQLSYALIRVQGRVVGLRWKMRRFLCETLGCPLPPSLRNDYIVSIYRTAREAYVPKTYQGRVILFKTQGRYRDAQPGWESLLTANVEIQELDTDHDTVFKEPYVQTFSKRLNVHLCKAQKHSDATLNSKS